MTALVILAAWIAISIPPALLVGRWLAVLSVADLTHAHDYDALQQARDEQSDGEEAQFHIAGNTYK